MIGERFEFINVRLDCFPLEVQQRVAKGPDALYLPRNPLAMPIARGLQATRCCSSAEDFSIMPEAELIVGMKIPR